MKHLLILKVRFMILKGAVNSTLFVDELEIIGE